MELLWESEEKEKLISECLKLDIKLKKIEKEWRVKIKGNLKIKQLNRLLDDKLLVLLWHSLEDGDYRKVFAVKSECRVVLLDEEDGQDSSNNKAAEECQLIVSNNEKNFEENELETTNQEINKTCNERELETIEQENNEITQENELETNDQQALNQVSLVLGYVMYNSVESDHQAVLINGNDNEFEAVNNQQANNQVILVKNNTAENDQIVPRIIENCDELKTIDNHFRCFCHQVNCDKSFDREDHLDNHLQNHLALRPRQCQWQGCGKRFRLTKHLINHLKRLHRRILNHDQLEMIEKLTLKVVEDDKKVVAVNESDVFIGDILETIVFKCLHPGCGKTFKSEIKFNCHKNIHTTECQHCQKCFKSIVGLKNHHRIHTEEKPYECDWNGCGKRLTCQRSLDNHKKIKHSDERPFQCLEKGCGKSFKMKVNLKSHLQHHSTDRPFQCPKERCDKRFKTKCDLNQHVNYFHSDVRKFQCEFENCEKKFKTRGDLKQHQRTHK